MHYNVLEYMESSASQYPNKIFCADETSNITYSELQLFAERIGCSLNRILQKRLSPIVVFMDKCPACLVSFFGIIESGNFYVCIDSKMAVERIKSIFSTLNPSAIITKKDAYFPFPLACPCLYYEDLVSQEASADILLSIRDKAIDTDPLYILYTSGSTGAPKGSVITHKSVIAYAEWIVDTFSLDSTTILGSQTPFYFSMSVLDIYSCIKCGGTLQIIPKKYFSFPIKLLQYLEEKQINFIYWVPSALCIVANWKALDYINVPSLKKILFAGEVMPTKQLNIWRSHLPDALYANLFGPTEITDIALYYILDREFADDEPIPIGKHCKNMDAFALTEDGKEISGDELGELYFRGSFVGEGYYYAPDKTVSSFVQNPLNQAYPEIVYRTGDLVRKNQYGEFVYAGRKDFQIKHMGYRIELGEIEAAASAHESVNSCVCLYDSESDIIVLFYQGNIEENSLLDHLAGYLPEYMRPGKLIRLPSMPYNANGKIDRQLLMRQHLTS